MKDALIHIHVLHVLHVFQGNHILGSDGPMGVHLSFFDNSLELMHHILEFVIGFDPHSGLHISNKWDKMGKLIDFLVESVDLDFVFLLLEVRVLFLKVLFPGLNSIRHLLGLFFSD